jgi:hypothetical protein
MSGLETEAATGEPCMEEAHLIAMIAHVLKGLWNLFHIKAAIWIFCGKCNGKT